MKEREVKEYLLDRVKAAGGEARKVRWENRNGAPDWLLMFPWCTVWVELKRPGEKPTAVQSCEHKRMRRFGQWVEVADSLAAVDDLIKRALLMREV